MKTKKRLKVLRKMILKEEVTKVLEQTQSKEFQVDTFYGKGQRTREKKKF